MNIVYFPDTDILYFELIPEEATGGWEVAPGVVVNYAEDGRTVGIEIEQASKSANMESLKVGNFPGLVEIIDRLPRAH
jgi:uncharacterized protein YuzE